MRGQKQYKEAHMLLFTNIGTNNIEDVRQASNKKCKNIFQNYRKNKVWSNQQQNLSQQEGRRELKLSSKPFQKEENELIPSYDDQQK